MCNFALKSNLNTITVVVQKVETIDHIDGDTGECLGTDIRIQTFQHEVEPPYVKLYTQDIGRLYGLTESTQNVLMALAKHMVYRTNVIVLYGPIKTILMQELIFASRGHATFSIRNCSALAHGLMSSGCASPSTTTPMARSRSRHSWSRRTPSSPSRRRDGSERVAIPFPANWS